MINPSTYGFRLHLGKPCSQLWYASDGFQIFIDSRDDDLRIQSGVA